MTGPSVTRLTGDLAQASVGATGSEVQTLGLTDWEIDFKVKKVEATTTDDQGVETSLPSTRSWTATAKYAYLDQDTSQATEILNAIIANQTPLQWNFFPTVALGRGAWKGSAYLTGCKISAGVGKLVALDVTLQGVGTLAFTTQLAPGGTGSTQAED